CQVEWEEKVPIGRPISNTEIYLLDEYMQPVPCGSIGELYIGGRGLALGYVGRPELTAERFLPHPFKSEPGQRLYRTGDKARYRADGRIEYLGRNDHQIKLRGYRIELDEIEAVINRYPAIKESLVVVHKAGRDKPCLVAYVVLYEQSELSLYELRL